MCTMNQAQQAYDSYCRGRVLYEAGEFRAAIPLFEKSLVLREHFKTLELLGESLLRVERPNDAIEPLSVASDLNPGPRSLVLLAEAFQSLGRSNDARRVLGAALARHPDYGPARAALTQLKA